MSNVSKTFTYEEDAETIWRAALHHVAAMGYTVYERDETARHLMCRTPSAVMKRSAGQVILITVTPLGPQRTQLVVLVTSYDERKEHLIGRRLLRLPREELIAEVTRGIDRLLPVVRPPAPTTPQRVEAGIPG